MWPFRVLGPDVDLDPGPNQMETLDLSLSRHKSTLQDLNSRLSSYILQVHRLESANQILEKQIKAELQRKSPVELKHLDNHLKSASYLQEKIEAEAWQVAVLKLQTLGAELSAFDLKNRCEHEEEERERVEAGLGGLQRQGAEFKREVARLTQEANEKEAELRLLHQQHQQDVWGLQRCGAGVSVQVRSRTSDSSLAQQLQSMSWNELTLLPLVDWGHGAQQEGACVQEDTERLELTTAASARQDLLDQLRTENARLEAEAVEHMEAVEQRLQMFGLSAGRLCDELQEVLDTSEDQTQLNMILHQTITELRAELHQYQQLLQDHPPAPQGVSGSRSRSCPAQRSFKASLRPLKAAALHSPRAGQALPGQRIQRQSNLTRSERHESFCTNTECKSSSSAKHQTDQLQTARVGNQVSKAESFDKTQRDKRPAQIFRVNGDVSKAEFKSASADKKTLQEGQDKAEPQKVHDGRSSAMASHTSFNIEASRKTNKVSDEATALKPTSEEGSASSTSNNQVQKAKAEPKATTESEADLQLRPVAAERLQQNNKLKVESEVILQSEGSGSNTSSNQHQVEPIVPEVDPKCNDKAVVEAKDLNLKSGQSECSGQINIDVGKASVFRVESEKVSSEAAPVQRRVSLAEDQSLQNGTPDKLISEVIKEKVESKESSSDEGSTSKTSNIQLRHVQPNDPKVSIFDETVQPKGNERVGHEAKDLNLKSARAESPKHVHRDAEKKTVLKAESEESISSAETPPRDQQEADVQGSPQMQTKSGQEEAPVSKTVHSDSENQRYTSATVAQSDTAAGSTALHVHGEGNKYSDLKEERPVTKDLQRAEVDTKVEKETNFAVQPCLTDQIQKEATVEDIVGRTDVPPLADDERQSQRKQEEIDDSSLKAKWKMEMQNKICENKETTLQKIVPSDDQSLQRDVGGFRDSRPSKGEAEVQSRPEASPTQSAVQTGTKRAENIVIVKIIEEIQDSVSKTNNEPEQDEMVWSSEFSVQKAPGSLEMSPEDPAENQRQDLKTSRSENVWESCSKPTSPEKNLVVFKVMEEVQERTTIRNGLPLGPHEHESTVGFENAEGSPGSVPNAELGKVCTGNTADSAVGLLTEEGETDDKALEEEEDESSKTVQEIKKECFQDLPEMSTKQIAESEQITSTGSKNEKGEEDDVSEMSAQSDSVTSHQMHPENTIIEAATKEPGPKAEPDNLSVSLKPEEHPKPGVHLTTEAPDATEETKTQSLDVVTEADIGLQSYSWETKGSQRFGSKDEDDNRQNGRPIPNEERQISVFPSDPEVLGYCFADSHLDLELQENPEEEEAFLSLGEDAFCPQDLADFSEMDPDFEEDLTEANVRVRPVERYVLKESPPLNEGLGFFEGTGLIPEGLGRFGREEEEGGGSSESVGAQRTEMAEERDPGFVGVYRVKETGKSLKEGFLEVGNEQVTDQRKALERVGFVQEGNRNVDRAESEWTEEKFSKRDVRRTENEVSQTLYEGASAKVAEAQQDQVLNSSVVSAAEKSQSENNGDRPVVPQSEGSLDAPHSPPHSDWRVYGRGSSGRMSTSPPDNASPLSSLSVSPPRISSPLSSVSRSGFSGSLQEKGGSTTDPGPQAPVSGRFGKSGSGEWLVYGNRERMSQAESKPQALKQTAGHTSPVPLPLSPTETARFGSMSPTSPLSAGVQSSPETGRFGRTGSGEWLVYGHSRDRLSQSGPEQRTMSPTATSTGPIEIGHFRRAGSMDRPFYGLNRDRMSRSPGDSPDYRSRALSPTARPTSPIAMSPTETGRFGSISPTSPLSPGVQSPTETGRFMRAGSVDRPFYGLNRDRMSRSPGECPDYRSRTLSPTARPTSPMSPTETGRFGRAGSGEWLVYGQNRDRMSRAESEASQMDFRAMSPEEMVRSGLFFAADSDNPQTTDLGQFRLSPRALSPTATGPYGRFGGSDSGEWRVYGNSSTTGRLSAAAGHESPTQGRALSPEGGRFDRSDIRDWMAYRSLSPTKTETADKDLRKRNLSPTSQGGLGSITKKKDWSVFKNLVGSDSEKLRKRTLSPPEAQKRQVYVRGENKKSGGRKIISSLGKLVKSAKELGHKDPGGRVISSRSSDSGTGAHKERISVCKMTAMSLSKDRSLEKKSKDKETAPPTAIQQWLSRSGPHPHQGSASKQ